MADNDQKREQEIQSAKNQKSRYEQQRDELKTKISDNNKKIERLRDAKDKLKEIKRRLKEDSKAQKKHSENDDTYYEWSGDKKDSIVSLYSSTTVSEYNYYIETVDNALDAIDTTETDVENENLESFGIVGKLGSWINSLASKIEKLCN